MVQVRTQHLSPTTSTSHGGQLLNPRTRLGGCSFCSATSKPYTIVQSHYLSYPTHCRSATPSISPSSFRSVSILLSLSCLYRFQLAASIPTTPSVGERPVSLSVSQSL
uniref:Uncharacterized protein n=1 Tax=Picea glauca TaxID=3330 RepID=A0A101M2R9_PICGL|nr:hypothetical protein ABT39_MTgene3188 [Picea glauca]